MRIAAQIDAAPAFAHGPSPSGKINRRVRRKLDAAEHEIGKPRKPQLAVQTLGISEQRVVDAPHRIPQLLLDSFRFAERLAMSMYFDSAMTTASCNFPFRSLLRGERQNVCYLLLALPQPFRVVVEEIPAEPPGSTDLMANHVPA
jgi:hypothetical protein